MEDPTRADRLRQYRVLLVLVASGVVLWVLWSARGALLPFFIGLVFAYLLAPLVNLVQSIFPGRGWIGTVRRTIAVVIVYALTIGGIVVLVMTVGPPIVNETYELVENLPNYVRTLEGEGAYWWRQYEENVPAEVRREIERNLDGIQSVIVSAVRSALTATFGMVRRVIGLILGLALLPLWLFYVLKDQRKAAAHFYALWPPALRNDVRNVIGIADKVLSAYIRGQLFLGLVVGSVTFIGLYVLDVQQAVALAVVAGLLEMVPILGPWIAFFAAAIVVLATDPGKIWAVAVLFFMIQQLENTFLVPKVQGAVVDMNPALIILLLVVGGASFGFIGIVVIVPLAAIARNVFIYVYNRLQEEEDRAREGPDASS
ncbi:MAG TPA: AI-2E family transporter [Thermomicrobiales bacterium]|nr:AI-2E family transporter [Thermomicrobiales bacterium]